MTTPINPGGRRTRLNRRSIRLKGYDYSQAGAYFITIVTQDRMHLFGEVINGEMLLNEAGRMILAEWEALPQRFPTVEIDAFVVMPNHIHGIIVIVAADNVVAGVGAGVAADVADVGAGLVPALVPGATTDGATTNGATTNGATTNGATTNGATTNGATTNGATTNGATTNGTITNGATTNGATTRVAPTVGDIVGAFKSITTVLYTRGVKQSGWSPFPGRLWQRNYYEHIIRNDESLNRIRQYIADNPAQWALDRENATAGGHKPEDT